MQPNQRFGRFSGDGGTTSATGLPKRVTRIGFRVLRTSSRMPRHLALNSEIAISFICSLYHGQRPWSNLIWASVASNYNLPMLLATLAVPMDGLKFLLLVLVGGGLLALARWSSRLGPTISGGVPGTLPTPATAEPLPGPETN